MKKHSAVVLLSGGIDSTTCLAMAIDELGTNNVTALNMLYGQKHDREIQSAVAVAQYYGVPYYEMDLSAVMEYSDCPSAEAQRQGNQAHELRRPAQGDGGQRYG